MQCSYRVFNKNRLMISRDSSYCRELLQNSYDSDMRYYGSQIKYIYINFRLMPTVKYTQEMKNNFIEFLNNNFFTKINNNFTASWGDENIGQIILYTGENCQPIAGHFLSFLIFLGTSCSGCFKEKENIIESFFKKCYESKAYFMSYKGRFAYMFYFQLMLENPELILAMNTRGNGPESFIATYARLVCKPWLEKSAISVVNRNYPWIIKALGENQTSSSNKGYYFKSLLDSIIIPERRKNYAL